MLIEQSKEKNTDGAITLEQGINIEKKFITPQRSNDNFFGRQIVRTGQIAYCTQLNNENVAVALRKGPDCIVSSVYDVIYIKDEKVLIPEYLMMWLSRKEFGRFVYWASQGTSYWDEFYQKQFALKRADNNLNDKEKLRFKREYKMLHSILYKCFRLNTLSFQIKRTLQAKKLKMS